MSGPIHHDRQPVQFNLLQGVAVKPGALPKAQSELTQSMADNSLVVKALLGNRPSVMVKVKNNFFGGVTRLFEQAQKLEKKFDSRLQQTTEAQNVVFNYKERIEDAQSRLKQAEAVLKSYAPREEAVNREHDTIMAQIEKTSELLKKDEEAGGKDPKNYRDLLRKLLFVDLRPVQARRAGLEYSLNNAQRDIKDAQKEIKACTHALIKAQEKFVKASGQLLKADQLITMHNLKIYSEELKKAIPKKEKELEAAKKSVAAQGADQESINRLVDSRRVSQSNSYDEKIKAKLEIQNRILTPVMQELSALKREWTKVEAQIADIVKQGKETNPQSTKIRKMSKELISTHKMRSFWQRINPFRSD